MGIRVIIALSSRLFADGVKGFFDRERDIDVVEVMKAGAACDRAVTEGRPDIVLVDFLTLYNGFKDTPPNDGTRYILFDTTCGAKNISGAVLSKGVCGVLPSNASAAQLKRAVRTVAGGGQYLDKRTAAVAGAGHYDSSAAKGPDRLRVRRRA